MSSENSNGDCSPFSPFRYYQSIGNSFQDEVAGHTPVKTERRFFVSSPFDPAEGRLAMRKVLTVLVLTMGVLAACARAGTAQTAAVAEIRAQAERGDADAQYRLGRMCAKGEGVPQDYMLAVEWFRKAAQQGNAKGQNAMGTMYASGTGVPQDYMQAIAWYRKAAEQGEMMAQANLGVMYDTGRGVPQDFARAAEWYRKAAEQGYPLAQCNLGVMYASGQGMPQNDMQAVVLYRKVRRWAGQTSENDDACAGSGRDPACSGVDRGIQATARRAGQCGTQ
jgi:TPR repeat protein